MRTLFVVCLILLSACHPASEPELSTSKLSTGNGLYFWNGSFPKVLSISNDFSEAEVAQIKNSGTHWEQAKLYRRNFFAFGPTIHNDFAVLGVSGLNDDVLGIYKVTAWPKELPASALAVTQLMGQRYNIGESTEFVNITHADILLNYEDYNFSSTGYSLSTVMLHEFGHFLGLAHSVNVDRQASVMYPSIGIREIKTAPTDYDVNELIKRYKISAQSEEMDVENQTEPGEPVTIVLQFKLEDAHSH